MTVIAGKLLFITCGELDTSNIWVTLHVARIIGNISEQDDIIKGGELDTSNTWATLHLASLIGNIMTMLQVNCYCFLLNVMNFMLQTVEPWLISNLSKSWWHCYSYKHKTVLRKIFNLLDSKNWLEYTSGRCQMS